MAVFSSHLTVLETAASLYPSAPAFKVPHVDLQTGHIHHWESITYAQFHNDVEDVAGYWAHTLHMDGIPHKSIVGLWLRGLGYNDVLHIYGLSRAGYVPQLFSLGLPSPVVVSELLQKANAKALIIDPSFQSVLRVAIVPSYFALDFEDLDHVDGLIPELPMTFDGDELAFVFHTSGSTSGSPKLVPCSHRWLNSIIRKAKQVCSPKNPARQDVTVWMGSMCHIGQTFMLLGSLQHGSCVIQPTKIAFSTDELVDMVQQCGLNRLNQFATFLSTHLKNSRLDSNIVALLSGLDEVLYAGLPLPRDDEQWAYHNNIKLKNLFGNTECGAMLLSLGGFDYDAPLLRPLEGVSYGFFPIVTASGQQSSTRLLELVILAQSEDCPDVSLRQADGHFHTGDLFEEIIPGSYIFRGRDDDWIKSENSLRCDTKAIEDNVRATCGHLIEECVVVGTGRPSPTLFVEPAANVDLKKLKKEIIQKTRQFHSRRYVHERITSTDLIVMVARNTLPRTLTKGNIRRKAVEDAYKSHLDQLYALVYPRPAYSLAH